jgi:hypothetical protein
LLIDAHLTALGMSHTHAHAKKTTKNRTKTIHPRHTPCRRTGSPPSQIIEKWCAALWTIFACPLALASHSLPVGMDKVRFILFVLARDKRNTLSLLHYINFQMVNSAVGELPSWNRGRGAAKSFAAATIEKTYGNAFKIMQHYFVWRGRPHPLFD